MPGSHPFNSPNAGSRSVMDETRVESDVHQPRYDHSHHQLQQPPFRHSTPIEENENDMSIDSYISGLSSPSESSATASGRNSVDNSITHGATYEDVPEINFAARFSDFVHSARREASSEHPVIETYIDNEEYQSLLAAVSNIHVSQSMSREGLENLNEAPTSHPDVSGRTHSNQVLTHSSHAIQDDTVSIERREVEILDDEDDYSSNTNSPTHIYDLQHIMVHNQRQLENQLRQSRELYARRRDSAHSETETFQEPATYSDNALSSEALHWPDSIAIGGVDRAVRQPLQEPYLAERQYRRGSNEQASFDPRPSISSSYFSPTTESTIVLSSPPPGRPSSMLPHNPQSNMHPHAVLPGYLISGHIMNASVAPVQQDSSPYRPFFTGRDITLQRQEQQEQERAHQHSVSITTNPGDDNPSDISDGESDHDNGLLVDGDNAGGHWFAYGSLSQRVRSFEQHRYQYYRGLQLQLQHRQSIEDVTMESQHLTGLPITDNFDPRPAMSLPQSISAESLRRSPDAQYTATYPGSRIPIPLRYINPQPFSHPQYTSTATAASSSNLSRPHDIMTTSYNHHNGYRQPSASESYDSSGGSRRRNTSNSGHVYSETVERAEAGGWALPSVSSAIRPPYSWYESSREGRPRTSIGLKEVVRMACRFCEAIICERGMKAQLLADQSVALLSTDDAPQTGNAIGYHITQPCEKCLSAENNGHLWLFHPEYVLSAPRWDPLLARTLRWSDLPEPDEDYATLSLRKVQQGDLNGRLLVGGMVRREYDAVCR
ncbi:Protein fam72b [Dissophora ornata]|nr:Protein fam72b [Dissophora ornata]